MKSDGNARCPWCKKELQQREGEKISEFARRMYCDKECAIKAQSERWHLDIKKRGKRRTS
jgi:competence CoiA-like predicted nuclease